MIPTNGTQLIITLVLVLPGFVYQETRIRLRGRRPSDVDATSRLLRAIAGSVMFAAVYAVVVGPALLDSDGALRTVEEHPRLSGIAAVLGAFGAPVLLAALPSVSPIKKFRECLAGKFEGKFTRYDPRPSAWDVAFQDAYESFVRVRMKDGTWYAGYFGLNSYATSFPDERSVFVEVEYTVDPDGTIRDPVNGSVGSVIDCAEAVVVEFLTGHLDGGAESEST